MKISEFYKYSWFADLAYIEWNDGDLIGGEAIKAALAAKRTPQKLADKIFSADKENYSVLSYHPNDSTGFKASLYGDGEEKILAIAGTETDKGNGVDLWEADIRNIGIYGVSISQAVSLFNYIFWLQAPKGTEVTQLEIKSEMVPTGSGVPTDKMYIQVDSFPNDITTSYFWFESSTKIKDTDVEIDANDTITLTGHSLGGHLAAFALRLFPELFDQAVTFNAPGFDPTTADAIEGLKALQLTDEFVDLFAQFLPADQQPATFDALSDRLYVLEGEDTVPGDDHSLVSSELCGKSPNDEIFVTTEKNSHSMSQLVDALGVQALLEQLNPEWGLEQTGQLISAASAEPGMSEETLVNALSALLLDGDNSAPLTPNGEAPWDCLNPPPFDARVALHTRLIARTKGVSP